MNAGGILRVTLREDAPIPLDVRFDCAPGEVLALVGPSGAGKTTILRAIAGGYRPQAGRISVGAACWFSEPGGVCRPAFQRAVGMVFQSYALFPHMTALGNVMAAMGHLPADRRESRGRELLSLVHLDGLETRRPAALSGGQQQRVALARALAREPAVLLLDEPFSAVDRMTRPSLYREIAALRRLINIPVLLVTHDLDEAMMIADRIAVLDRGHILAIATPSALANRPPDAAVARLLDLRTIISGRNAGRDRAGGRQRIDWAGGRLEAVSPAANSLGERTRVLIPEGLLMIRAGQNAAGDNPIPAVIGDIRQIGQTASLRLLPIAAPEQPLHALLPLHSLKEKAFSVGAPVTAHIAPEDLHVLD